jgi:hypothetical protein
MVDYTDLNEITTKEIGRQVPARRRPRRSKRYFMVAANQSNKIAPST